MAWGQHSPLDHWPCFLSVGICRRACEGFNMEYIISTSSFGMHNSMVELIALGFGCTTYKHYVLWLWWCLLADFVTTISKLLYKITTAFRIIIPFVIFFYLSLFSRFLIFKSWNPFRDTLYNVHTRVHTSNWWM